MNFNLKKRLVNDAESESRDSASKRNRLNAFPAFEDDEDNDNDDSSFRQAVLNKASRIKMKLMTATNDFEELESENGSSEAAQNKNRNKGDNSGLSYIESLRRSRKERAQVRDVSRQETANKLVSENTDATVFESENYKKHKQHIENLKSQEEEQDEQEKDDLAFYTAMLQARERGVRGVKAAKQLSDDNHTSGSEMTAIPAISKVKDTILPSSSTVNKKQSGPTLNYEDNTTTTEEDYTRLVNTIKQMIKPKLAASDLEDYKDRYWKRRLQILKNRNPGTGHSNVL